ncbi:MAG: adenosylmethionine decarboxylase [Candidatus Wallbacteria bacterium]|nr:adenosylmethionine decarboxylase [Candidatus Wallbacteria bacterium]
MKALGRHILVEFYDCDRVVINDLQFVEDHMKEAARVAGATIVKSVFHLFNPHGVSGVVVIAESHLAIHTWPEYGYCAVDLFTCGDSVDPWISFDLLKEKFKAKNVFTMELKRGQLDLENLPHKPAPC